MVFVDYSFVMDYSSSIDNGASNVNAKGNLYTIQLDTPIRIPREAKSVTAEAIRGRIWNLSPNIAAEYNNNTISFVHAAAPFTFTFPDGLYSRTSLNNELVRQFTANALPVNLFTIGEITATANTTILFNYATTQIDFTDNAGLNIRTVLGFNSKLVPAILSVIGDLETSDTFAKFNRVDSYIISLSFLSNGIPVNAKLSNALCEVPIDVPPGSQINYQPFNPIKIDCSNLRGQSISSFQAHLTDQLFREVDTLHENWSVMVVFRFSIQLANQHASRTEGDNSAKHLSIRH